MSLGTLYISIVPAFKADHANEKGFSLIELMIALVIFSVVVALFASARIGQQDQELSQQQAVEMQQTARSALLLMSKDIRMAGYDPKGDFAAGITGAGNGSAGTSLDLAYVEGFDGIDNDSDGQVDETDELNLKTVSYQLLDRPSTNPDGDLDLTVQNNGSGGYQLLAENIPSLDLAYLDADGNVLAAPVALDDIRAVQVAVTVGVDNKELDRFPENNTRTLTTTVNCRNLGLH